MRYDLVLLIVILVGSSQASQIRPEPPAPPSQLTDTVVAQLPLTRPGSPMILFDRAVTDKNGGCRVHHAPLKEATVPIVYGLLVGPSPKFVEAERKHFPNGVPWIAGGCLVMSTTEARVLHCRKCLRARDEYNAEHTR